MKEIRSLEHFKAYSSIKEDYSKISHLLDIREEFKEGNKMYKKYTSIIINIVNNVIESKMFLELDYSLDQKLLDNLKQ